MIPKKAQIRINKTKKTLKMYGETFENYMRECCQRYVFNLGQVVNLRNGKGIICGWNSGCNYDVYFFDRDEIYSVHPNEIKRFNP